MSASKCIITLILFLIAYHGISQNNDKNIIAFDEEVLSICPICKKDKRFLNKKKHEKFHKSHLLFEEGKTDSSYVYVSRLIEENEIKDPSIVYLLYVIKGRILNDKLLFDDAIKNLTTAIEYGKEVDSPYIINIYAILGRIYLEKKDYQKGITILEDWKMNYADNDSENSSAVFHNLGLCYLHIKNYSKAEENLYISYELNEKAKDTLGLARSSLDIANLYYVQYKDEIALTYFEKGLEYAKKANDLLILQNAYLNLAIVEENNKAFSKSLIYRKDYEKIKDSIWNKEKIWELAKKDKEIGIAARQEKLNAEKWKKDLFIGISIIFLVLLLTGGYLYYKTIRQNRIISKQKEHLNDLNTTKDKLFSLLTHDLKTPMYVLNKKLLNIRNGKTFTSLRNTKYSKLVTESYQISKNTILQIENTLHWILGDKNQLIFNIEKLHLSSVIDQVVYDYIPVIEDKKVYLKKHADDTIFVNADLNSLKIVLRNILDNAIKFSHPEGAIFINVHNQNSICELQIIDHGVGFCLDTPRKEKIASPIRQSPSSTKLGLRLSRDLIKKNKGEFKIQSEPDKGTTVSILLNVNTD